MSEWVLKIGPYHMPKFGGFRKMLYLCKRNQKEINH